MRRLGLIRWAAASALVLGCGPQDAGGGDEASPMDESGGTSGATSTGSDTGVADGSSTGSEPAGPVVARDIGIEWVEVNQGVGVEIGRDGVETAPQDRTAFLLANRIALVRAFWTLPGDWEPREIEGQLHLSFPDGTTEVLVDRKVIDEESFIGNLSQSFFWGILAEQAVPGLKYHIELYETDQARADEPEPSPPPRLPADGSEGFVGIEDSYQILKVVIVPFNYNDGADCVTTPDTSEETMQLFHDQMYQMNPIDRLDIELHDPIDFNEPLEGFVQLNALMSELRFEEGALPETYYYGLVDVCSGGLGGAGGQAYGIPTNPTAMEEAYRRVSSGLSLDPEWSAETFVHEVGHSQGRRHVACNGEEGGPDTTYPVEGGAVGEWGFGVLDFALRHPTFNKDYMTYCHPVWVSTWGWNKVYPTIKALSAWDADSPGSDAPVAPDDPYRGSVLVGTVLPSGKEIWHTAPGTIAADASSDVELEFAIAGQVVARTPASVETVPDGDAQMIIAPLPEGFHAIGEVTRLQGNRRFPIARHSIAVRHHFRNVAR